MRDGRTEVCGREKMRDKVVVEMAVSSVEMGGDLDGL